MAFYIDVIQATNFLRAGQVIAYPTDTVWGLLALLEDNAACQRIYTIKGREPGKPLQVLVCDLESALALTEPQYHGKLRLVAKLWPGPLTMVVPGRGIPPWISPDGTVGLRMPADPVLCQLIWEVGGHVAATSLNKSGEPPVRTLAEALNFDPEIAVVAGSDPPGTASTVVDLVRGRVIREGVISGNQVLGLWH